MPRGEKYSEDEGWYDYEDWKLSPAEFFLEQFVSLTWNGFRPKQVYEEFCKIREFNALDEEAMNSYRGQRRAA